MAEDGKIVVRQMVGKSSIEVNCGFAIEAAGHLGDIVDLLNACKEDFKEACALCTDEMCSTSVGNPVASKVQSVVTSIESLVNTISTYQNQIITDANDYYHEEVITYDSIDDVPLSGTNTYTLPKDTSPAQTGPNTYTLNGTPSQTGANTGVNVYTTGGPTPDNRCGACH